MAGRDEDRIGAQRSCGGPGVGGAPAIGGAAEAPALLRGNGVGGGLEVGARLHFDKDDGAPAPGDDVDFAALDAIISARTG